MTAIARASRRRWASLATGVALLGALAMLSTGARADELHRWVDANGQVHISDSPAPAARGAPAATGSGPSPAAPSEAVPGRFREGLLWRVEPRAVPGAPIAPSYVFGTMHSSDPRVRAVAETIEPAFRDAKAFCAEASFDGAAMLTVTERMFAGEGRSLDQILGRELFDRIVPLLEARGLPGGFVPMLRPWVVLLTLSVPASAATTDASSILDLELMNRAQSTGKTVCGVETLDEQVDAIEAIPERELVAHIRAAADAAASLDETYAQAIELYVKQDLAGLASLDAGSASGGTESRRLAAKLTRRLLDDRNVRMAARIADYVQRGGAFVAIGAGHLAGERGVLALLEKRGFVVERVAPSTP
ncbi:MAG: TraB/GumN family protein [bacterium]